jgi:hypothetical protein
MLNRRRLLLSATASTTAAALPALPLAGVAHARAPFRNQAAPAWYRFRIGEFEATVVSDGALPIGAPGPNFPAVPQEEIASLMRDHFLPTDSVLLEQNVLVVNTGRHLVLFDTGMGESMGAQSRMFGPTTSGAWWTRRTDASSRTRGSPSARPTCATGRMTGTSAGRSS